MLGILKGEMACGGRGRSITPDNANVADSTIRSSMSICWIFIWILSSSPYVEYRFGSNVKEHLQKKIHNLENKLAMVEELAWEPHISLDILITIIYFFGMISLRLLSLVALLKICGLLWVDHQNSFTWIRDHVVWNWQ